ncbi:MAG TPA: hypothetical protein VMV95_03035 [Bacillota bacterium]|nr:hypothetical protein [Bacillota bacterium]
MINKFFISISLILMVVYAYCLTQLIWISNVIAELGFLGYFLAHVIGILLAFWIGLMINVNKELTK